MQRIPRFAGLAVLLAAVAASSSCEITTPFDPCPLTNNIEDVGQMDYTWTLQTVNAVPLPYPTLKLASNEKITELELHFETDYTVPSTEGCKELYESQGTVYAQITLTSTSGTRVESGAARFVRDHVRNTAEIETEHGTVDLVRATLTSNSMLITSSGLNLLADENFFVPDRSLVFSRTRRPGQ